MTGFFQVDASFFVAFSVLLSMGILSLILFVFFYLKHRAFARLPKGFSASVFDRTFNVFDPYGPQRKLIQSSAFSLFVLVLSAALLFSFFVAAKVFELGLILSLAVFVVCVRLIVVDEAFEVYRDASVFIKAARNGTDLGRGDLNVLGVLREILPKLKWYYLSLAVIFLVSSVALPFIMPSAILVFAQLVGVAIALATSIGSYTFFLAPLSVVVFVLVIQVIAKRVRSKIFGFPSPDSSAILERTFERMKTFASWSAHHEGIAHRPYPEPENRPESE